MKFIFNAAPNLRQKQSTKQIMLELTIALLVVFGFSLVYYQSNYGFDYMLQAIILMLVSVVTMVVTESIFAYFKRGKEKYNFAYVKNYLSTSFGWVTAIILTLMCPISITPYALIVATFFAIFFGKLVFGGFGFNIFNPAALGRAVIFATFMGATTDVITSATPTGVVASQFNWLVCDTTMISEMMDKIGGLPQLFLGWYPGAIGETSTLIILLCGIILAIRQVIDWRVPTIYLGSIFVLAMAVALMRGVGAYNGLPGFIWYPLLHICIGGAAFGAVFMLTDPVTSPTSAQGRCIFALGAAILTMLIRIKANLPEGCLYSILLMNMLSPMIERAMDGQQLRTRKKAWIISGIVALLGLGAVCLAGSVITPKEPDPVVTINCDDETVTSLKSEVVSEEEQSDGSIKYVVRCAGYAAGEDENQLNEFEISVKDNKITAMSVTKVVDTEYVGDKICQESFLNQFVGKDLNDDIEVDAVSGATFSSRSASGAVQALRSAIND